MEEPQYMQKVTHWGFNTIEINEINDTYWMSGKCSKCNGWTLEEIIEMHYATRRILGEKGMI